VCATFSRTLLTSPNFYGLNLHNLDAAAALVNQLVRLDRLPPSNALEGLLLLQDAWRDYDVAMWLGGRYKRLCKLLFVLQLVISWAVVLCATLSSASQQGTSAASGAAALREAVFGLAIAVSVLLSLDGVLTPKARWRQLRSSAGGTGECHLVLSHARGPVWSR